MRNLAQALHECEVWDHLPEDARIPERLEIETMLQRSGMGLREVAQMATMPPEENLLVVVDQFEELFRFHKRGASPKQRDKAEAFVNLLLEGARDETYAIHVVLTMRSGFFGECAAIEGLSEVINRGAYLVPRLTRDQLKEAIEGPVRVFGAKMAARLTQRVLNDAGGAPDELPVLQHALMRTWDHWTDRNVPGDPIDLEDYDAIGGMGEALSRHADEVYHSLSQADQRIAERLFKALTEKDPNNRGIRRPMRLEKLTGIIGCPEEDLMRVIDAYRAPHVSFLMPSFETQLRPDSIVDISHESLMRVWKRLGGWVEEEMQSARIYQRLTDTAKLWEDMQADLYHDPDLHIARAWYKETQPNALWADQYGGGFARAMRFLNESKREKEATERATAENRERELANARALARERERSARRARRSSYILAIFSVLLAFLAAAAFFSMRFARDQAQLAQAARLESEAARMKVSSTFSRSDYQFGQSAAENGRYGEALAYLTRALKNERGLTAAGDRIYSILTEVSLPVTHFHHRSSRDIEAIAFSPDSQSLLVGSYDGSTRLFDVDSNAESTSWQAGNRVNAVAISHDGTYLASATRDGQLILRGKDTGRMIHDLETSDDDVNAIAFSKDDTMIASASDDGYVRVFEVESGQLRYEFSHHDAVNDVQFSTNNKLLASASDDDTACVWELESGTILHQVFHNDDVNKVDFHPLQTALVTASEDDTAKIWSLEDGSGLATLPHDDHVREAEFSPDGNQIGTASNDKTARLWSVPSGLELHRWSHREAVDDIAFSPDGKLLASASDDQTVRIWETQSGWESPVSPLIHRLDVDMATFSPDGKWLGTVADNEVRVWRFEDLREPPLTFGLEKVTVGALSPDGAWATAGSIDGILGQWDTTSGQSRHPEFRLLAGVSAVIYSRSGDHLIAGDIGGNVRVWEAGTGRPVSDVIPHEGPVSNLVMVRNDRLLVAHGDTLTVRDLPSGGVTAQVHLTSAITAVQVGPEGTFIAAGTAGGTVSVRNPGDLSEQYGFSHNGVVTDLAFAPQRYLASASNDWSARLWDLNTGEQHSRSMGHGGDVTSVEFDKSGKVLATGSQDQRARLWSTETASVLGRSITQRSPVVTTRFAPEGLRIATATADHVARLWDVTSTLPLTQPLMHTAPVTHLEFSPNGRQLFTVAPMDGARLWNVSLGAEGQEAPDIFLEVAQAIGGMELTNSNQLVPLNPIRRRMILGRASMSILRSDPAEDDAYKRFIRKFMKRHHSELNEDRRRLPPRRGRPARGPGRGGERGAPPEMRERPGSAR